MSELEKCMGGNILNCIDNELLDRIHKARILTRQYNSSSNAEEKESVLNKLLGKIGSNVKIDTPFYCDYGKNIFILPDVTIGKDSVIGAASVVTKNIPQNCVAVGNPCRIGKQLSREVE
jgi:maltose O-acetyltransferase